MLGTTEHFDTFSFQPFYFSILFPRKDTSKSYSKSNFYVLFSGSHSSRKHANCLPKGHLHYRKSEVKLVRQKKNLLQVLFEKFYDNLGSNFFQSSSVKVYMKNGLQDLQTLQNSDILKLI